MANKENGPGLCSPGELSGQWRSFRLERPRVQTYDSSFFPSNYGLLDVFERTLSPDNALAIAGNLQLQQELYDFLERVYLSEDSCYLTDPTELLLQSKDAETQELGLNCFYHTFKIMGFLKSEVDDLLYHWEMGMEGGNHLNTRELALKGLQIHVSSIITVERFKKGGFHELYKNFGICNAARYYNGLKHQLAFMTNRDLFYIQAIMASGDYNGSMLEPGFLARLLLHLNPQNSQGKVIINTTLRAIEVQNHVELICRKRALMRSYGQGKVTIYFVSGHGESDRIDLGSSSQSIDYLTMEDIKRLDVFGKNSKEHVQNPTIILNSCSTGTGIAREISDYVQAKVFAPTGPSSIVGIEVTGDKPPGIKRVFYSGPSVVYDCGRLVDTVSGNQERSESIK